MSERRWYVVHTQPNGEARADLNLRRQGFATYLPRYARRREGVVDRILPAAIAAAARDAVASDFEEPVVLLSPACASFDQYPNFEVRGKAFTETVLATPGVTATVNAS